MDTDSLFPLLRGGETAADIVRRSREYERQVIANDALENEVKFLATREGGKWAVYRYLGLVEPGQHAGRVVEASPPAPVPLTQPQRVRRWIVATEERGAQFMRGLGETALCYARWRPLDGTANPGNEGSRGVSKTQARGLKGGAGASASPTSFPAAPP
ncbi:MAG: hypothetical protein KKI08_17965 [Armatimonadetes bacterium]|nr:hypothetical protein [Armatimonadota bacterium]